VNAKLRLLKSEVSEEALAELALELSRKEEEDLQRLVNAVLSKDYRMAEKLAKELQANAAN
jgi:hypothetical protein